ncbi:MAG: outer membrane protein assembly factor BamD [Candidatus Aminicenantes bacterium]|nr:outer membrane protein assembly factor BamD [Candidatus Aminicenantes bacterium]
MRKTLLVCIIAAFMMGASFCAKAQMEIDPEIASNEQALFEMGQKFIKKNPEKGRLYFRQVIDAFPQSLYAQRAMLAIADSYYKKGDESNMIIAASEYREFVSRFPNSPSVPYAQYRIAMTYFTKSKRPGKDQTKTKRALEEFKILITRFPTTEEAQQAQEKIKECEEKLAMHSFKIAKHYNRVKAYKATIDRLKEILTKYPNFSKMDQLYYYLADSYYNSKREEQAIPYLRKLITDYPDSKFAKKAIKKIEEYEEKQEVTKKSSHPKQI